MKKIVLLMFVICAAMTASAQVYVGGNVSFWDNDDADFTNFTIAPEVGYNFSDKWAVGIQLAYMHNKLDVRKVNTFVLAPYARYSYFKTGILSLFVDGGVGYASSKPKDGDSIDGFEIGLKPGLAIKLNDTFSLTSRFGFIGYREDYGDALASSNGFGLSLSGSDLTFGLQINF